MMLNMHHLGIGLESVSQVLFSIVQAILLLIIVTLQSHSVLSQVLGIAKVT